MEHIPRQSGAKIYQFRLRGRTTVNKESDQILLRFAEYGIAASKSALTSQLAKDRHLFLPLGGNVFQLIEQNGQVTADDSLPLPTAASAGSAPKQPTGNSDELPPGNRAINFLRELSEPLATGVLKTRMVERGLVEDSETLFPWLHTALKRKEKQKEIIYGEDRKWYLPEWIKVDNQQIESLANDIQEQLALEQVSALRTENPTELPVGS